MKNTGAKKFASLMALTTGMVVLSASCTAQTNAATPKENFNTGTIITILPGDKKFKTPKFSNYETTYNSAMGKNGRFSLQARKSNDGKKLSMIDIIPMKDNVIVAQRVIDLKSHRSVFSAQPYFAWGMEYIVGQNTSEKYDWQRVPIGGGEAIRTQGELANAGGVDVMFSPTLASLMPMDIGTKFRMPEIFPRKGGFVSSELNDYKVLRKEHLELKSGVSCDCWVIEKTSWGGGSTTQFWVSREAPFVFRRHRDVGGKRDSVSDVMSFRIID